MDFLFPSKLHNSSVICGTYGDKIINSGDNISLLTQFWSVKSLTAIIKFETAVLNEYDSISPSIFLIVL